MPLPFRSPTVLGVAWGGIFGWDGKFPTLESVAFTPIEGDGNMHRKVPELLEDLAAIPGYRAAFAAADRVGVTRPVIEEALATYQRTLAPGPAPFDRWVEGDEGAVTERAKRGFDLFTGRAGCATCHEGWRLTDEAFHDVGIGEAAGRGRLFPGSDALQHAWKTPTLRDVDRRAPYMHNGSLASLPAVLARYEQAGPAGRSPELKAFILTPAEREELLAFLGTLTGDARETAAPILPR